MGTKLGGACALIVAVGALAAIGFRSFSEMSSFSQSEAVVRHVDSNISQSDLKSTIRYMVQGELGEMRSEIKVLRKELRTAQPEVTALSKAVAKFDSKVGNLTGDALTRGEIQEKSNAGISNTQIMSLKKDGLFMMDWKPSESQAVQAKTISDGCHGFHGGGFICYIESPEHALVRKWLPKDASVMEFGGRYGTTTCEIAKKIGNSGRLVAVEADRGAWQDLEYNVKSHHCLCHLLRGVVGSEPMRAAGGGYGARTGKSVPEGYFVSPNFLFDDVEAALGFKIDTLLIDCEGCAQHMMDQIGPKIKTQINLVLLEADMGNDGGDCQADCMDYSKFFKFLEDSGLKMVDKFNDCDRTRTEAPKGTWCGPWINHYAFSRV